MSEPRSIYVLRHGPTEYSRSYRVNGDVHVDVPLTEDGPALCRAVAAQLPLDTLTTCMTSAFSRTRQTAHLLLAGRDIPVWRDARLNEVDYGMFEGRPFLEYAAWLRVSGPRAVPPGAGESLYAAILRMFIALTGVARRAQPALVVGHGLMLSVLTWVRQHPGESLRDSFYAEARYLEPMAFGADELCQLLACHCRELTAATGRRFA